MNRHSDSSSTAGLLPRILWRFFESFNGLGISILEIYREQIHDLLNHRSSVKCYSSSAQTIKHSVTKLGCYDYRAALKLIDRGNRQRVEVSTRVVCSVSILTLDNGRFLEYMTFIMHNSSFLVFPDSIDDLEICVYSD